MSETPHILVVEDEEHMAKGIRFNLEAEGYRVSVAGDGPSALAVVRQAPSGVDLVLLDIMLPGMSGYDVCEELRSGGWTGPVLILSARTLSEDRARGFGVGANQYMTKPFDLDEFLARVKNLLTHNAMRPVSQPPPSEPVDREYSFADTTINFDTFEVNKGDETVRLTQLEMNLLKYFVANEGRVIPRGELLERVWKMPARVQTRAPDQFIRRLRKIFEPDPANPRHFLTLRDAGYRFVAKVEE